MTKKYLLAFGLALLFGGWMPALTAASESKPQTQPELSADQDARWKEALENIQNAIDEDPDEAAKFIGSTPIQSLDLEELEKLSDKALQFTQIKEIERIQRQQEERERLRDYQNLQNSRR